MIAVCARVDTSRPPYRLIHLFLDSGADINEKDADGLTALMHGCALGLYNVVKILLTSVSLLIYTLAWASVGPSG